MAVCGVILRGQQIYTVIQAVDPLLYIVAKCHFFQCCHMKIYNKIFLKKCEGGVLTSVRYCESKLTIMFFFCFSHKITYQ